MTEEQRTLAKKWCILNARGWPEDEPLPPLAERQERVWQLMSSIMTKIGIQRCLEYWNSDEFAYGARIKQVPHE